MVLPKYTQGASNLKLSYTYSVVNEAVGNINYVTYLDWCYSTLI